MTRWIIDNGTDIYHDYYKKCKENESLQEQVEHLQQYKTAYKRVLDENGELQSKHGNLQAKHRKSARIIAELKEDLNYYINQTNELLKIYHYEKEKQEQYKKTREDIK